MLPLHCCNLTNFNINWNLTGTVADLSSDWHNLSISFLMLSILWFHNGTHWGHFHIVLQHPSHGTPIFICFHISVFCGQPKQYFLVQLSKSQIAKLPICNLQSLNSAGLRAEQPSQWLKLLPVPTSWCIAFPCCNVSRTLQCRQTVLFPSPTPYYRLINTSMGGCTGRRSISALLEWLAGGSVILARLNEAMFGGWGNVES